MKTERARQGHAQPDSKPMTLLSTPSGATMAPVGQRKMGEWAGLMIEVATRITMWEGWNGMLSQL